MPPPKAKKLTAQPVRTRHFVGKPAAAEVEDRSSSESESEEEQPQQKPFTKPKPAPVTNSFPKSALKSNLAARQKSEAERKALEDQFETESEDDDDIGSGSGSGSDSEEESSEDEESSSEDEAPKLLRPVFLKKQERGKAAAPVKTAEEVAAEEEARREEEARTMIQEQVEQRIAEKAAGKRDWDDDVEDADINAIDDTDGLDLDAEFAAWKLRELKRIKRERVAIEEAEAERAEIERRRNLSAADREAEDRAFIEQQKDERGDRGDMQYMQKYFHKGAFFTDEMKELGIDRRNLMGARFEDQTNREVLPEFMQIRDMTKLGKKGRTRYKDMKSEDTGKWADYGDDRPRRGQTDYSVDERFRPDSYNSRDDRDGATGANARPLGERKRLGEAQDGREGNKRHKSEGI